MALDAGSNDSSVSVFDSYGSETEKLRRRFVSLGKLSAGRPRASLIFSHLRASEMLRIFGRVVQAGPDKERGAAVDPGLLRR